MPRREFGLHQIFAEGTPMAEPTIFDDNNGLALAASERAQAQYMLLLKRAKCLPETTPEHMLAQLKWFEFLCCWSPGEIPKLPEAHFFGRKDLQKLTCFLKKYAGVPKEFWITRTPLKKEVQFVLLWY